MREGKHNLHYLLGEDLFQQSIINIPNEKMNIGVYFLFFIYFCSFQHGLQHLYS
jgi:hypothetical protein